MITDKYTDKDGKGVVSVSTGSKFEHFGKLYIEEYENDSAASEISAVIMEDRAHCPEQDSETLSYISSISDNINEASGKQLQSLT